MQCGKGVFRRLLDLNTGWSATLRKPVWLRASRCRFHNVPKVKQYWQHRMRFLVSGGVSGFENIDCVFFGIAKPSMAIKQQNFFLAPALVIHLGHLPTGQAVFRMWLGDAVTSGQQHVVLRGGGFAV